MMTRQDYNKQRAALQEEMLSLQSTMRQSDEHAIKCWKLGLDFKAEYPADYAAYTAARERYNQVEQLLAALDNAKLIEEDVNNAKMVE